MSVSTELFGSPPYVASSAFATRARTLLDFTQKLDIGLLDTVVTCLFSGSGTDQQVAGRVLHEFKEHSEAWTRVDAILEFSQNQQTKYFALQILESLIQTRWKILPRHQCEGRI
jgi:exportin-1